MHSSHIARWIPWLIVVVSLAGFADATYLTVQHLRGVDVGCSVIAGCEQVLTSTYAEVGGVPIALAGALFYLTVLILAMVYIDTGRIVMLRFALWLTVPGFFVTLILLYLQAFVIGYWCQFCLISALVSSVLFFLGVWLWWTTRKRFSGGVRVVMATSNLGKVREMQQIFSDLSLTIVSAAQAGADSEVIEDGKTLKQNALKKARRVAAQVSDWVVSDDTGIFVDALNGRPGVRSARFAGENVRDDALVERLLQELQGVPLEKRTAQFTSVLVLISPAGDEYTFTGTINGTVTLERHGSPKFSRPYDVIFQPANQSRTFAEMTDEEKNRISHRRIAFDQLRGVLLRMSRDNLSKKN